jgi:hypothetical protein
MQISRTDELDLLTVLHDGMHEQPAWGTFLGRLLRRVGADCVRLVLARGDAAVETAARLNARQVEARQRSLNEPGDPLPYGSLRPQRVYDFAEFQTPPEGAGRVVRVIEDDLDAWLVIHSDEEFSASAGSLLSALSQHFRIALRNYTVLEDNHLKRRIADRALKRLGRGWMALTASGRIMATDSLADALLREGGQLRMSAERRILAGSPVVHQRLMRAIEAASADPQAPPHCVRISDDPQLELLVTPIGAPAPDEAVVGASVAVHIQAAPSTAPEPAQALGELFELSPSTARFAWALAQTGGIADAAEQLGLSIETARFYSKTLYAKLGVKGQAELTRRVLTSAAALA